ncbi:MAG: FKBP-type peptidyl-prolyl cis-trans isomerase [Panacagrimonas sp.]|jgi:FKBP-type peptidyl-prolyl cis-trans isomerase|nr:FKBP-type peptidyl-prolyl cis-trans isomerase [Panacagrimonas sp.]MCC2658852.1 FKBP-type peptidyl-prolyl cis-trans isomerase [Panacagrimonas sp.]
MSKTLRLVAVCACAGLLFACNKKEEAPKPVELTTDAQKFGYSIGIDLGNSLKPVSAHVDVAALKQGLDDVTNGAALKLDDAARDAIKQTVSTKMQEEQVKQREEAATKAQTEGEAFLAENAKKEGVKTTASGLQYKVITEGSGESPTAADEVTVHYKGTLINGEEFDSSISRGQPVTFPLGNVIEGWTEGVQLMKPGAKYQFFIPSKLAYGERGAGVKIGPNQTLIFEVELIEVKKAEAPKK